jgi:hypothetical protein
VFWTGRPPGARRKLQPLRSDFTPLAGLHLLRWNRQIPGYPGRDENDYPRGLKPGYNHFWVIAVLVYLFFQGSRDPYFVPVALLVRFLVLFSFVFHAALYGRIFRACEPRPSSGRETV